MDNIVNTYHSYKLQNILVAIILKLELQNECLGSVSSFTSRPLKTWICKQSQTCESTAEDPGSAPDIKTRSGVKTVFSFFFRCCCKDSRASWMCRLSSITVSLAHHLWLSNCKSAFDPNLLFPHHRAGNSGGPPVEADMFSPLSSREHTELWHSRGSLLQKPTGLATHRRAWNCQERKNRLLHSFWQPVTPSPAWRLPSRGKRGDRTRRVAWRASCRARGPQPFTHRAGWISKNASLFSLSWLSSHLARSSLSGGPRPWLGSFLCIYEWIELNVALWKQNGTFCFFPP